MENKRLWIQKKGRVKKNSLHSLCKDRGLPDEESSESQLKKFVKKANSHRAMDLNILRSQVGNVFLKDLPFTSVHGLKNRIPNYMVSVDGKYLSHCLEFIHISALKAAQYNIPVSLRGTNIGTLSESLKNTAKFIGGDICGTSQFVFECPVADTTESVVINTNATQLCTLGTLTRSKSMINFLNNPMFQQFGGTSNGNENLTRMNSTDVKELTCFNLMDSPSGLSISSCKLAKETSMVQSHKYGSISVHKRLASISSTDSKSSVSSTSSQGMLQCTWKQGIPYFLFSADDQKEVYEASLRKIGPTEVDKALDYVYLFYLKKGGQKGLKDPDSDLELVGKMNVSTSFTLCPNNYRIMETEFILFGTVEICDKEVYTSSHSHKSKGLSKKVSQIFRRSPSSIPKFSGSSSIVDQALGKNGLVETNVLPNFELAAIVVKDHLPCATSMNKVGGWGLKFLNKAGVNQSTLPSSESCSENIADCSTSMSILIPAGLHGGPRTRNGGPSSLIDRWESGGSCDCGGWDEGCPLKVLQRRSNNADVLDQLDMKGQCKSVDLVTQGSNDSNPTMRMVNVHDGLYFIQFQPSLSPLQSLSIAVVMIHMESPTLRSKIAQEL